MEDCAFATSADSGATCETFLGNCGISVDDPKSLNPQINCSGLDTDQKHCVVGTVTDEPSTPEPSISSSSTSSTTSIKPSSATATTSTKPNTVVTTATSTTSAGNGITTPAPAQPGIVSNCNKFHYISRGDTCSQVYNYETIPLIDFVKWNSSVKDDCSGLWAEAYVCVSVIGGAAPTTAAPSTTTKATNTTSAGNGVVTPTPTQPRMVGNCAKFHWVSQGTTRSQILSYDKISLAEFATWNPSVKADCLGLWAEVNVCVGLIGGSPTTTTQSTKTVGNGITTPTPIQPGMVSNCKKFHYVSEGNVCSQITSYEEITLANFIKWNTGVGSTCSNMWSKTYVCVGV